MVHPEFGSNLGTHPENRSFLQKHQSVTSEPYLSPPSCSQALGAKKMENETPAGLTLPLAASYHESVKWNQYWPGISLPVLLGLICLCGLPSMLLGQGAEQQLEDEVTELLKSKNFDEAVQQAKLAVRQFPQSSGLYQLYGVALMKNRMAKEAQTAFRRALELDPSLAENCLNLALSYLSEDQYEKAVAPLETYLKMYPRNPQAHILLGRAYHNLNRTIPAIEQFKKAIELSPHIALAHYHLGYAYQSQGELKSALEEFQKEIRDNPDFYDSYWLAGNIELRQDDLDRAAKLFQKGATIKPRAPEVHYGLGRVLLEQRRYAEALTELQGAVKTSPQNAEIHYALARTYQQMEDRVSAEKEFQICATLNARNQKLRSGIAGRNP